MSKEDDIPIPNRVLHKEHFLKAIKYLSGKEIEGVPLFSGKMEVDLSIEWIEGIENYFECENVIVSQKVKVAQERMRGEMIT